MRELTDAERAAYAEVARLKYASEGSIEFDDKPCMSYSLNGEEGAYVQAWVWVSVDDIREE